MFALDSTIVADVQPKIVDDFGAVELLPWLALAFMIPSVGLMLPNGQLFQTFNAKWLYITGVVIFEVGSALCGAAPNIIVFIIARAVSGIARAFIYSGTLFLISVNTNETERYTSISLSSVLNDRPMYMGLIGTTWGLGTVLGPILGGALAGSLGWRWAFYLNLPIGLFMVPIAIVLLPNCDMMKGCSVRGRLRRVDWIGSFLLLCFTGLFLTVFAFAGNKYAWNSEPVIGMFSATGIFCIPSSFPDLRCPFPSLCVEPDTVDARSNSREKSIPGRIAVYATTSAVVYPLRERNYIGLHHLVLYTTLFRVY